MAGPIWATVAAIAFSLSHVALAVWALLIIAPLAWTFLASRIWCSPRDSSKGRPTRDRKRG
jgi:hypothetical protein